MWYFGYLPKKLNSEVKSGQKKLYIFNHSGFGSNKSDVFICFHKKLQIVSCVALSYNFDIQNVYYISSRQLQLLTLAMILTHRPFPQIK